MKYYIFIFLLTTCACGYYPFGYQSPPHIKHADKLAAHFACAYAAENQLVQIASGGGMMYGIEHITCYFEGFQKINIEESRRMFVNGVESFCAIFNNDLTIRPYLKNYPFVQKNIRLRIAFEDPIHFQPYSPPYVSLIFCERDKIFYSAYDPKKNEYVDYYDEPYAEAVRIVHEEREAAIR